MPSSSLPHCPPRSLDSFALQLAAWSPFVSPSPFSKLIIDRERRPWPPPGPKDPDLPHPFAAKPCESSCSRLSLQTQEVESIRRPSSAAAMKGLFGCREEAENPNLVASNSSDFDIIPSFSPRGSSWSRRQKQMSRALTRGLWRWRGGSRARKRRRRAGTSRSASSDRAGHGGGVSASDPATVGASATHATCSDFPIVATDSSGELFLYGVDGNAPNWDREIFLTSNSTVQKREGGGGDLHNGWLALDNQSLESGYGSEPGYRGDSELEFGDDAPPDEQDEEEKEPLQLCTWRKLAVSDTRLNNIEERMTELDIQEGMADLEILDEEIVWELVTTTNTSDQKMHHRLRRRRQDWRSLNSHNCVHA